MPPGCAVYLLMCRATKKLLFVQEVHVKFPFLGEEFKIVGRTRQAAVEEVVSRVEKLRWH